MFEQKITAIVQSALEQLNIELLDIKFLGQGSKQIIRVFVDEPGGITIGRCADASRMISDYMDRNDPIPTRYTLQVSSPGIDWPLRTARDYMRHASRKVKVIYDENDHTNEITGRIINATSDELLLDVDGTELILKLSQIIKSKIIIEF